MCGIAGIFGHFPEEPGSRALRSMVHALRHRGPDGVDIMTVAAPGERRLFLGHARLSILDLSDRAAQPMAGAATGSWLIYNGELYNFAELRAELEARGHHFRSTGDTEVLLKALVEWGPEAMRRLRGIYAFAYWEGRTKRLILGRDPFGIKPLLMARTPGGILFASEIRALGASGLLDLHLNPMAIRAYLAFGCVIEPATIFQEVVSLPPGHIVVVEGERVEPPRAIVTLGDLWQRPAPRRRPRRDVVNDVRAELQRSVGEQLVSDVPVGIFLSGGIDSSIVAALADRTGVARDLRYLTVCFPEQEFSELGYARQVARSLSGRHETVSLEAHQVAELLPRALAGMDQPSVDGINTYVVSSVAAERGIKVVLSGLGGDEIFGGYTTFWKAPLLARFPALLRAAARLLPARLFRNENERRKLLQAGECFDLRDAYLLQRSIRWDAGLGADPVLESLPDSSLATPETWELMTTSHRASSFSRVSFFESVFYMRNQLLRDSDIMSSANSIELRVPFLDMKVMELAWSVPGDEHLSRFGGGKMILKEVLNGLIPNLPLGRRKMGFVFPWQRWLRDSNKFTMIADVLHSPALYEQTGIDPAQGRLTWKAFMDRDPRVSWMHVWSLFVLLDWKRRNAERRLAA